MTGGEAVKLMWGTTKLSWLKCLALISGVATTTIFFCISLITSSFPFHVSFFFVFFVFQCLLLEVFSNSALM